MLKFALTMDTPVAIRYPRGLAYDGLREHRADIEYGKSEIIYEQSKIALYAVGSMVKTAEKVRDNLIDKGKKVTLVNARFVKPIDTDMIDYLAKSHDLIVTMEENVACGGFGEHVLEYVYNSKLKVRVMSIALPDEYVEHGNVDLLAKEVGIDADTITEKVLESL